MNKLLLAAALAAVSCGAIALLPSSARAQGAEEGYFTGSDGNRLYYRKLGAGEPTLVYLHGGPINMNDGGYEIDRLGRGRTLIIIDQRSGGRSELVQDKERLVFSRYVEDVEALRVHFGLQKMMLAGQSFGAMVAASYAARYPDRVERLMFWSPGPPTSDFLAAREIATNRFLGEADARRAGELWSRMAGGPDSEVVSLCREWVRIIFRFYVVDPAALSRMKGDYCAGTPATIRHQNRAMDILDASSFKSFDLRPELRTLRVPALVVEGAETRVPLDATEEWARVMPDARLLLIPGCGHQTWLEGGDAFFEAVERFIGGGWPATAVNLAQESSSIADPGAGFEPIFTGGFFLESPAVAPDGSVYFSDITYSSPSGMQAGHIMRYDPSSGVTSVYRSPSGMANGIEFDAKGDMIVAEGADFGGRRVTRTDMRSGKSYIIAGLYGGHPFNAPNDLAIDAKGRIYFTDPRYLGPEPIEQPVMGVYRIDPDGGVHLLAANLWMPNGIAVSPDQKTLYVVSVGSYNTNILEMAPIEGGPPSAVHAYDLLEDGTLRYRKPLVTFADGTWGDGMTVDVDGNIYVAVSGTPKERGVHVYTPAGQRLAFLPTPEDAVNLDFGRGTNSDVLYVACSRDIAARGAGTPPMGNGLYSIRLHRRGSHAGPP